MFFYTLISDDDYANHTQDEKLVLYFHKICQILIFNSLDGFVRHCSSNTWQSNLVWAGFKPGISTLDQGPGPWLDT